MLFFLENIQRVTISTASIIKGFRYTRNRGSRRTRSLGDGSIRLALIKKAGNGKTLRRLFDFTNSE